MISFEDYTKLQSAHPGWLIHPLSGPGDNGNSPGKRPLITGWPKLQKTSTDIGNYIIKGCNLGLVCGKASNVTIIDYDHTLFWDLLTKGIGLFTLSSQRTQGRGHVYFQYTPELKSHKHHNLGIEILSDGSNAVLPPSKHVSGDVYQWVNPDAPLIPMPAILLERLNTLFETEARLVQQIGECRPCFKKLWNSGKPEPLHGADGREVMLAWAAELKAKGAGLDEILMLARLVYKNEFSNKKTAQEWKNIKTRPWTCRKIQERLSGIISCSGCQIRVGREKKEQCLPPVPVETINGSCDLPELITTFKKWLHVAEDYNIKGPVCAFLGNFLPFEVDIIGIVAPSGSSKTEILRSFGETENQYCYPVSSITEHTFVSGHKDNVDTVLLLRYRSIIIKDLTTLLSKKEEIRSAVFADFRELTDGYIRKEFGNGIKKEYRDIHSSILFGSTNAIERYYSMYSNLGARMMFMRPVNDPELARKQSVANQPRLKEMRNELHSTMMAFIKTIIERLKNADLPVLPDKLSEDIGALCDFLAVVRTQIHHNIKGDIDEIPEPEFPTRIFNTVYKFTKIHAFIHNRTVANEEDESFAMRFIMDNVPTSRMAILRVMSDSWQPTPKLSELLGFASESLKHILHELTALGVVEKLSRESKVDEEDKRSDSFRLDKKWIRAVERLRGVIRIECTNNKKDCPYEVSFEDKINKLNKNNKRDNPDNNNTIPLESHPSIEQVSQTCGICGAPLNGKAEFYGHGLGYIHPECLKKSLQPQVLQSQLIRAKDHWEKSGKILDNSNITGFSLWFCENYSRLIEPSGIKAIASKLFRLTPVMST